MTGNTTPGAERSPRMPDSQRAHDFMVVVLILVICALVATACRPAHDERVAAEHLRRPGAVVSTAICRYLSESNGEVHCVANGRYYVCIVEDDDVTCAPAMTVTPEAP